MYNITEPVKPANVNAMAAEVVIEIPENLALAVKSTGLDTQSAEVIEASFAPLFVQANRWRAQVAGLVVTDVSQVREMKLARESRLALKEIRVLAGKNKDRLKEDSLKRSRAVDSIFNNIKGICEPLEAELLAQEQFALRAESARLEKIKAERAAALTQYGVDCAFYSLDVMPAPQFEQLLAGSKAAHEAKIEAARKAEAERIAKEQAEIEERARIAAENERLKAEAFAAEKAAQAERERVATEKREAAEKAREERKEIEAAMLKQKQEAEAKAKAAADAAAEEARKIKVESDRLAKIAADAAKAERDAIEAKARSEREAAEKKAEAERAELRRQAKAAADAQAKAEAEAKAIRDAEAARIAAEEVARRKAASAPDREKVLAFAEFIRAIPAPVLTTEDGKAVQESITSQLALFADWLVKKGGAL